MPASHDEQQDPAQQQRRGPPQVEIDPAAPQERDADQAIDRERYDRDRRYTAAGPSFRHNGRPNYG